MAFFTNLPDLFWLIILGVFLASFVQSSVGIGFGLVATPILLLAMNDTTAIQVSIFTAALLMIGLIPSVWADINFATAKNLIMPATVALPIGLLMYAATPLWLLKIIAAIVVVLVLLDLIRNLLQKKKGSSGVELSTHHHAWLMGATSGIMEVICAIPGPALIAHMAKVETAKARIRATIIFIMGVFSIVVLFASLIYPGVSFETFRITLLTLPAIFLGGILGIFASRFISEYVFKWLIILLVACMALVLVVSAF